MTYGLKLNLGNYQTATVEYSFEYYLSVYTPEEAFGFARSVVERQAEIQTGEKKEK